MNPSTANDTKYPQTKFFQACRMAFEGGGCRGAAHIGAYEAAVKSGINVSEVAGTSAGSIVAVLVGAGATPEYLLKTCAYLQFNELLAKPKGIISNPLIAKVFGYLLSGYFSLTKNQLLGSILRNGSGHSSEKIQQWVDDRLAELLPHAARPIKFKDLILPTWVVATDLAGRRAKIWSTEQTPNENVALAVRCSSSIPVFFEPVQIGNDLYVDGGMLSNLPTFVFAKRASPTALGGRILALQLQGISSTQTEWKTGALIKRLIDTSIDGGSSIQQSMQSNVSAVAIDTGDVSSTNFAISKNEVDFLLNSGRQAIRSFIANEHSQLGESTDVGTTRSGEDELYDDLVREMITQGKRLAICCEDTKWFWSLFPSVAHWAFSGARIDVLVQAGNASKRELHRRKLLIGLGARIQEVKQLPFTGMLLSRTDDSHNSAFILHVSESQYAPYAAVYVGVKHRPIIQALLDLFDKQLPPDTAKQPTLTLKKADTSVLIDRLKAGVNQYVDQNVSITLEKVKIRSEDKTIKLIVRRIRTYKYRQIPHLVTLYKKFGLEFCEPADVYADDAYVSTIVPPVLEEWSDDRIAIEGNTRISYMHRMGITEFTTLLIRGTTADLPGVPVPLNEVLLSTFDLKLEDRIKGHNQTNFRSVEGAIRPHD